MEEEQLLELLSPEEKKQLDKLTANVESYKNVTPGLDPGLDKINKALQQEAVKEKQDYIDSLKARKGPEQEYLGTLQGQIGALEKGIATAEAAGRLSKESARVGAAKSLLGAQRRGGVAAARQAGLEGSREAAVQRLAAEKRATDLGKELTGAQTEFVEEKEKIRDKGKQYTTQLQIDISNLRSDMLEFVDRTFYTSAADVANAKQLVRTLLAKYSDDPYAQGIIKSEASKILKANTGGALDTSASTTQF